MKGGVEGSGLTGGEEAVLRVVSPEIRGGAPRTDADGAADELDRRECLAQHQGDACTMGVGSIVV